MDYRPVQPIPPKTRGTMTFFIATGGAFLAATVGGLVLGLKTPHTEPIDPSIVPPKEPVTQICDDAKKNCVDFTVKKEGGDTIFSTTVDTVSVPSVAEWRKELNTPLEGCVITIQTHSKGRYDQPTLDCEPLPQGLGRQARK